MHGDYNNELIKNFASATDTEVSIALDRAGAAFQTWRWTPIEERMAILQKAADLLREKRSELGKILTTDMGKRIAEAEEEVDIAAGIIEQYARKASAFLAPQGLASESLDYSPTIVYEPMGVILAVEPWNYPYYQAARVIGPHIAAGNTLILKPASNVPQTALAIGEILTEAGLPEGVFTTLFANYDQISTMVKDDRVQGVALTGSEKAGRIVGAEAGANIKKTIMELGGADAFIILDDVDIDAVVEKAMSGRFYNSGQICSSAKRFIVVDSVYDEFLEKFKAAISTLKGGDPLDPQTNFAPLSSQQAVDNLKKDIADAVEGGATAIPLGEVPTTGAFLQPTILINISKTNPVFYRELFGPVPMVFRVKDEEEAIKVANDSPFGLGGSIHTKNVAHARELALKVEAGMVFINHGVTTAPDLPFGGVKNSGFGVELGEEGIHAFVTSKLVAVYEA